MLYICKKCCNGFLQKFLRTMVKTNSNGGKTYYSVEIFKCKKCGMELDKQEFNKQYKEN